jgi:hypothetical protein
MYYQWLGETLAFVALTSDFRSLCKTNTDKIFRDLMSDLVPWLSQKTLIKYKASLREKVLQPAVDVHRMIRCSGKKFDLDYDDRVESPVSKETMESDIIDIEFWRDSKKSEIKGVFGCLMPSLTMRIAIGQRDIPFVPPVLLGYKTDDLRPDKSRRSSLVGHQRSGHEHAMLDDGQILGPRGPPVQDRHGSAPKSQSSGGPHTKWWGVGGSGGRSEGRKGSTSGSPSSTSSSASRKKHDTIAPPLRAHTMPASIQNSRVTSYKVTSTTEPSLETIYVSEEPDPFDRNRKEDPAYTPTHDSDLSIEAQDSGSEMDKGIEPPGRYSHPPKFRYTDSYPY